MSEKKINIGVLGLWHLGCVYSASLAELGFNVTGFDEKQQIVANLKKGIPPIEEPDLRKKISNNLNKTLTFTSNPKDAISNKKYIFITYDVPVDDQDQVDLKIIDQTFAQISQFISPNTTIVISSQLPIGTSRKFLEQVRKKEPTTNVIYFPENLRLGTAFESFLIPDRVVIGSNNPKILDQFESDFAAFSCPFIKIGLESSEMVKHALNSYLANMISFSSEMSDLSEIFGANMNEVVLALKSEKRVSKFAPLNPGLGFAGGTLGRDVQTLRNLGKKNGYYTLLLNSIYRVNKERLPYLVKKIKSFLKTLDGKTVGILGLTYKPKTNTLRRSMSLELATLLKKEGSKIKAFDPSIKDTIETHPFIKINTSSRDFFQNLDTVVLMTEWEEFGKIDWSKQSSFIKSKAVFDCKNFLDKNKIESASLKYLGIGYPL